MKPRLALLFIIIYNSFSLAQSLRQDTVICNCSELLKTKSYSFLRDSTSPFTGKCRKYGDKSLIIGEFTYEKGNLHGKSIKWYSSGKLKSVANYYSGGKRADYTIWYENGNKKQQGFNQEDYNYSDGVFFNRIFGGNQLPLKYGGEINWYENGNLKSIRWNDTTLHISSGSDWDESGILRQHRELLEKGGRVYTRSYYETGMKERESIWYPAGTPCIDRKWYENGQKASESFMIYDRHYRKTGTEKQWTGLGKYAGKERWRHGKLVRSTRYDHEKKPGEYP
jgi:antitoxin component YwqK of YwqJK toxin-antitoxin module